MKKKNIETNEQIDQGSELLRPYLESLPDIMRYQVITKALLAIWLFLLGKLFRILLNSTGRVAVSSGDFAFLFATWQGILIIVIGLSTLFVFVALDINTKIILSRDLLLNRKTTVLESSEEALNCLHSFFNIKGLGVILYIALIAPIVGIGFSITLTEGLYIPSFISSVIVKTPFYLILMILVVLAFASIGIANLFLMHGVVIDKLPVKDAGEQSKKLIRENWKDYLKQNCLFILVMTVALLVIAVAILVIPLSIAGLLPLPSSLKRGSIVFFLLQGIVLTLLADMIATPFYIMKMTQLYYTYKNNEPFVYKGRKTSQRKLNRAVLSLLFGFLVVAAFLLTIRFDFFFPLNSNVKIIAHRAGGSEAPENTIAGLNSAYEKGVYGAEIDIQRTKDGYYVINHDANFERVAKDNRKPNEMTLAEVKKLSVDGESVPTLEEMLDASKGKLILFIELKGETADKRMADDTVRIVKEHNMKDEVVLISLKYDVINYIESNYPEMKTGYLTFASFGDTALLNCDYLALEEESATRSAINAVHKQGKKVLIWTANGMQEQRYFLCSGADAIITDNITQANEIRKQIKDRSDLSRMIDKIKQIMG